jgi:hypothetical protein
MLNPAHSADGILVVRTTNGEESVTLQSGAVELVLSTALLPFLETVLAKRDFAAAEAFAWRPKNVGTTWERLQPILSLLVENGILVPGHAGVAS